MNLCSNSHRYWLGVRFSSCSFFGREALLLRFSYCLDNLPVTVVETGHHAVIQGCVMWRRNVQLVAAFAVSATASNWERLSKPFNPLLGETYELDRSVCVSVDNFCQSAIVLWSVLQKWTADVIWPFWVQFNCWCSYSMHIPTIIPGVSLKDYTSRLVLVAYN